MNLIIVDIIMIFFDSGFDSYIFWPPALLHKMGGFGSESTNLLVKIHFCKNQTLDQKKWDPAKGQLLSKCPDEKSISSKITTKIFLEICPEIFCSFLGASWDTFTFILKMINCFSLFQKHFQNVVLFWDVRSFSKGSYFSRNAKGFVRLFFIFPKNTIVNKVYKQIHVQWSHFSHCEIFV